MVATTKSKWKTQSEQALYGVRKLLRYGVDRELALRLMKPSWVVEHLDSLLELGYDVDRLAKKMPDSGLFRKLSHLLEEGASVKSLIEYTTDKNKNQMIAKLATMVDITCLVKALTPNQIADNLLVLLRNHADCCELRKRAEAEMAERKADYDEITFEQAVQLGLA